MVTTESLQKEELLVITFQATKCNEAFAELYQMFYSQLFDYICKISNNADDAFDITQETFIKVAQEIDKLRQPITFRFWLFRIAKNLYFRRCRQNAKLKIDRYEDDLVMQDYSVDEAILKEELLSKLETSLEFLSIEEQILLNAKYVDGKSIKDLMVITNLGSSSIKMKLMRARNKMETELVKMI